MHHLRSTRRDLLARGLLAVGSGTLGLSVTGASLAASSTPSGALASAADAAVLSVVLSTELLVVFTYRGVLDTGVLATSSTSLAEELLGQELAHVRALTGELGRLGGAPPPGPASVAAAENQLAAHRVSLRLSDLHTDADGLQLLIAVEEVAQGTYFGALSRLAEPALVRTATEIMASEAQHATVLSELRTPGALDKAVPYAYVEGRP